MGVGARAWTGEKEEGARLVAHGSAVGDVAGWVSISIETVAVAQGKRGVRVPLTAPPPCSLYRPGWIGPPAGQARPARHNKAELPTGRLDG